MTTGPVDTGTLAQIERRVLWLAVRMVDHANRRGDTEVKVGGHQASSASMATIMTALWFAHIGGEDKVAVKPHASPVYHAIKYLTGELDREWLTTLRQRGGLQAYPSRTKDPDVADFSTGSVGLGAVAPLFSAATRRYVDAHFGERPPARFIATVGDAELDEGNVWEAIADPATQGLGNVTLVVDLNRQSLDRVVPGIQAVRLERFFAEAGWHVVEAKYGHRLQEAFAGPGGAELRAHIDAMPNEAYQSLFALDGPAVREKFLVDASASVRTLVGDLDDGALTDLVFNLGGHDLGLLVESFRECDRVTDRPSVVFAYTIKGHGLPLAGDPLNHAALLTPDQIDTFRSDVGLTDETEWDRFDADSAAGLLCAEVGGDINNLPPPGRPASGVPSSSGPMPLVRPTSTQEAFGRVLTNLADIDEVRPRLVTTSPDVSLSTNLGGFINKRGVFAPDDGDDHGGGERLLRWAPSPEGQHIELGISEMNLFLLLGQLGMAHEHHGEMLLPVGTVYDPFVLRGLDAFVYSLYNGSRFVVAGTPSGVTLAPEGGAHQSTITPSVGLELPGVCYCEPAFAPEVDWLLCDGLDALGRPDGESLYLRLSTRPIDQAPFVDLVDRVGDEQLRADVLAGGYRLLEPPSEGDGAVTLVATGAMVPEAVEAAAQLADEGVDAGVVVVTSADRIYRGWQGGIRAAVGHGSTRVDENHLDRLVPIEERDRPIVSVHDGSSHTLAWLGTALGCRQYPLGVERFGESGTIADLHELTGISAGHIVSTALLAVS
ncbi:MAG: pyruvate dehydrogenase [Actinomycetia bacterium]|nr:pyruvate dehydrogenase [Actinomycetes bacterium]MCP4085767.1 pyruvate dehydrogenase [Actinomycetes bacterium]